jgi:stalled ribosome alternative rescue factor ArfA
MAVTSQSKRSAGQRRRRGRKMKPKKTVKRRNAPAASLTDPRYRRRVVKSAKTYSRKGKTVVENENE